MYFENERGGKCITFSGTPDTPFYYSQAFSFLNQSRKAQFIKLLSRTGNLPLYYAGDEEVYFKYAMGEDGCGYGFLFNIGTDPIDEIVLVSQKEVAKISVLTPDGKWEEALFSAESNRLTICRAAFTLMPVAIRLEYK